MIDLFLTAQAIQKHLERLDWKYCFIGGLALQRWGEPRVTQDIDLTVFAGLGNEIPYIRELLQHYLPYAS